MDLASKLSDLGGLLFLLSFVHFIVDWGFQSHNEAMQKATNKLVRARHCVVYTMGLLPLVIFLFAGKGDSEAICFSLFLLWVSHFLIDTYIPVYVWALYFRKPPEMMEYGKAVALNETGGTRLAETELEKFKGFAKTPLGLFLVIAMDQAWHILFLVPVASLAVFPEHHAGVYILSSLALVQLAILTAFGLSKLKGA